MDKKALYIGATVAALAFVGWVATTKAKAADLGGDCCADLEARVAELEATTARKGNRKVSLQISGHIGHQVLFWDDGTQSDMYIGDGGNIFSRFRLRGEAKINPELTAGFTYEFGINNNAIGSMNQLNGGDDLGGSGAPMLRDSTVWLRHKNLGMLKIGHGSTATDNLILIDVAGLGAAVTPDAALYNGSFLTRLSGLSVNGVGIPAVNGILTPITWGQFINGGISFDTTRRNHILYETPTLAGFTAQASVAEDDFWDVALRFGGEFSGFRVAAGIGYSVDKEVPTFGILGLTATEIKTMMGSASVMHMQSGLFVNVAAGQREIGWAISGFGHTLTAKDPKFWHVTAGWSKNVFGPGKTVLYGEYMQADDFIGYQLSGPVVNGSIESSATMWGIGVVQHIDAAAMEVFLSYKRFSADAQLAGTWNGVGSLAVNADMHDFSAVILGTRINF